jgi:ABC-type uncharacterized transport system substrate-binding protein
MRKRYSGTTTKLTIICREAHDNRTTRERISDYFVNDGPKLIVIILWVIANAVVFGEKFYGKRIRLSRIGT